MPPNRLKPPQKPDGVALLNRLFLTQYHMRLLTLFGGSPGWQDPLVLEEALETARAAAERDGRGDPIEVAAIYGLTLARGAFLDANLRLAAVAMAATLRLNELSFSPPAQELLDIMHRLEANSVSLQALMDWMRPYVKPVDA